MKDESPFAAVHRILATQFNITDDPGNLKTMMLIEAVRDALPPHPQATIASLRAILRDLHPNNALDGWANRMSREIVEYISRLAVVHKVAVAVDDERMWCSLEGMISGMLLRVTQGKDLEPPVDGQEYLSPQAARLKEERDDALARLADAEQKLRDFSWTSKA